MAPPRQSQSNLRPSSNGVTTGSDRSESEHLTSPVVGPQCSKTRKKGRGKAVGFEVIKRLKEGQKIDGVFIPEETFVPIGPAEKILKMELGIITRLLAPLRTFYWKKMTEEMKEPLLARLQSEFEINLSNPHAREVIEKAMATRFKHYKNRFHAYYQKISTGEEAREKPPPDVQPVDWISLCDHFDSEEFQHASKANKENRKKLRMNHTSGSKSYSQRMFEMENCEDPPIEPKEVRVYHDVHRKKVDGTWIHPEAQENYEQMEYVHAGSVEDGVQLTGCDILEKVLKPTKSNWGRVYGVKPQSRTRSTTQFQARSERELLLEKKVEEQQAQIEGLQAFQSKLQDDMHNLIARMESREAAPSDT